MTATACRFDAARLGHRTRTAKELRADLLAGCRSLCDAADRLEETGTGLDAIGRTLDGLHYVVAALRAGGADHGA